MNNTAGRKFAVITGGSSGIGYEFDGTEGAAAAILQGGQPVDILALNAGRAVGGPFLEADLQSDLALIDLNLESVVHRRPPCHRHSSTP